MEDILYLSITVVFFLLTGGLVKGCERLMKKGGGG